MITPMVAIERYDSWGKKDLQDELNLVVKNRDEILRLLWDLDDREVRLNSLLEGK